MSEVIKDSAIKLFGKTISLPPDKCSTEAHHLQHQQSFSSTISTSCDNLKSDSEGELTGTNLEDAASKPAEQTPVEPTTPSDITSDPETSDKDSLSPKQSRTTDEPSESGVSQEKTPPTKPDKILPCPRCKSMDTKFCYYNNYNVNQPRHFCRICQRYWTAGGTMRNVPVGSGRRKNKNAFSSNCSHFIVSDAFQASRAMPIPGMQLPSKPNSTLLMFGNVFKEQETRNPIHHERKDLVNPQSIPMTFYPSLPSGWNMPFLSTQSPCTLGKRSYDGNLLRQPDMVQTANVSNNTNERCVLVPKTLRFDDPNVTAMSSIWSSLGIKPEKMDPTVGIFTTLPAKGDRNSHVDGASLVLQANPAAMSRSLNFRESI